MDMGALVEQPFSQKKEAEGIAAEVVKLAQQSQVRIRRNQAGVALCGRPKRGNHAALHLRRKQLPLQLQAA